MKTTLLITEEQSGARLDSLLAAVAGISRSAAAGLIEGGHVTLCGRAAEKKDRPAAGDELCYELPDPREVETLPQDIPLAIVYEDRDIREDDAKCAPSEAVECFSVPWFKHLDRAWIERYAAAFRKVIENHEQLLTDEQKSAMGGRWYGTENA